MRHERLGQCERSEAVCCERHVPAKRISCDALLLHDTRVVEKADDRQTECDDLHGRAPHARDIRQVAHDRHGVLALLLDDLLDFVWFSAVTADQNDRAVLGQFECREPTVAS
jgi:hypothetical protein